MELLLIFAVGSSLLLSIMMLCWRRRRRYQRLEQLQKHLLADAAKRGVLWFTPPQKVPDFSQRLVTITNLLPATTLAHVQSLLTTLTQYERSYIPGHKQGGTISYEALHHCASDLVAFYHSSELRAFISQIVGVAVVPTPLHDQSSCSLLHYNRPHDHIGWHYDINFYPGRHFTVLLCLTNINFKSGLLSDAQLQIKQEQTLKTIPTPANTLVIFEGAYIWHRVTALGADQQRTQLSMTFCTNPQASWVKSLIRRSKDMAYFGIRALWT